MDRYERLVFLSLDSTNADDDSDDDSQYLDIKKFDRTYQRLISSIESYKSQASAFLIVGNLKNYRLLQHYRNRVSKVDLYSVFISEILSSLFQIKKRITTYSSTLDWTH